MNLKYLSHQELFFIVFVSPHSIFSFFDEEQNFFAVWDDDTHHGVQYSKEKKIMTPNFKFPLEKQIQSSTLLFSFFFFYMKEKKLD